jgi:hypothetical protein
VAEERWRKKFRTVSKLSGIEKRKTCLFVPMEIFDEIAEVQIWERAGGTVEGIKIRRGKNSFLVC